MKKTDIYSFFETLQKANPVPKSDLDYTNPFTLLVAVVLSAQSTDKGVNKVTPELFKMADTPEKMVKLGEEKIRDAIKTIGLFNTKARNIYRFSEKLVRDHGGQVPDTREELMTLPGVGRKSANVVLNVVFGAPTMAVDTHVFRVANRTGLANGKTPEEIEEKLIQVIPKEFMDKAGHWLVLLGRYVCLARNPKCAECPVRTWCKTGSKLQKSVKKIL